MSEIKVNIYDYLDEDKIKEMVEDETRRSIRKSIEDYSSIDVFIANTSYKIVWNILDEVLETENDTVTESIKRKVHIIIQELTSFSVFRDEDRYSKFKSVGQKLLDEAVIENKDVLRKRIKNIMENEYLKINTREEMAEIISESIYNLLMPKGSDND